MTAVGDGGLGYEDLNELLVNPQPLEFILGTVFCAICLQFLILNFFLNCYSMSPGSVTCSKRTGRHRQFSHNNSIIAQVFLFRGTKSGASRRL